MIPDATLQARLERLKTRISTGCQCLLQLPIEVSNAVLLDLDQTTAIRNLQEQLRTPPKTPPVSSQAARNMLFKRASGLLPRPAALETLLLFFKSELTTLFTEVDNAGAQPEPQDIDGEDQDDPCSGSSRSATLLRAVRECLVEMELAVPASNMEELLLLRSEQVGEVDEGDTADDLGLLDESEVDGPTESAFQCDSVQGQAHLAYARPRQERAIASAWLASCDGTRLDMQHRFSQQLRGMRRLLWRNGVWCGFPTAWRAVSPPQACARA